MLNFFSSLYLLLFWACFTSYAQNNFPEPFLDNSSGFYGYQLPEGKVKIDPRFSAAYPFTSEGYAKVIVNGRQGVINKKGKFVIDPIYENVGWSEDTTALYSEGLIGIQINGKWGISDIKGNEVLSPRFEKIAPFTNSFAVVADIDNNDQLLYGLIDIEGKNAISMSYQYLQQDITSGFLIAKKEDENGTSWGIVTNGDLEKLPFVYREIKLVAPGLFAIKDVLDKWGIYDNTLAKIYPHALDSISEINNGQFIVKANDHYAVMDEKGKLIEPFSYKFLQFTAEGLEGKKFKSWQLKYPEKKEKLIVYYDSVKNIAKNIFAGHASNNTYLFNNSGKLILTGQYDSVAIFSENYLLVHDFGLTGLADTAGKMVLPIKYLAIKPMAKDKLLVQQAGGGIDIFDFTGANLTQGAYTAILPQENGWFKVTLPTGSIQFLDLQLNVIERDWQNAGNVKSGLAAVQKDGLFGVTNFKDTWVISPYIDSLHLVNQQYMLFYDNGRQGTVNYEGVELYKTSETEMYPFPQGCTLLKQNEKQGLLNAYGTEILPPVYDSISAPTQDSLVYVFNKGKVFYMDVRYQQIPEGNEFAKIEYDPKHTQGYFRAKVYGLWGFVDYLGRIRVYCQYDDVHYFSEGLAGFKLGGKWGFLNTRGQIVIQPVYETINTFNDGKAIVKRNGKWGLINMEGMPIIPFEFDEINITPHGNYKVKQNGLTGIYRKQDLLSIYPKFDSLHDLGNGTAVVEQGGRYGINQLDGITIVYPEYDKVQYNPFDNSFFLLGGTSAPE